MNPALATALMMLVLAWIIVEIIAYTTPEHRPKGHRDDN